MAGLTSDEIKNLEAQGCELGRQMKAARRKNEARREKILADRKIVHAALMKAKARDDQAAIDVFVKALTVDMPPIDRRIIEQAKNY